MTVELLDDGIRVAFAFFALGLLVSFFAGVLFGLVDFMRRLLG